MGKHREELSLFKTFPALGSFSSVSAVDFRFVGIGGLHPGISVGHFRGPASALPTPTACHLGLLGS